MERCTHTTTHVFRPFLSSSKPLHILSLGPLPPSYDCLISLFSFPNSFTRSLNSFFPSSVFLFLRMQKLLDILERLDVLLVFVRRCNIHDLVGKISGDASIVEHVHKKIVEITIDDAGAGDVLRG